MEIFISIVVEASQCSLLCDLCLAAMQQDAQPTGARSGREAGAGKNAGGKASSIFH